MVSGLMPTMSQSPAALASSMYLLSTWSGPTTGHHTKFETCERSLARRFGKYSAVDGLLYVTDETSSIRYSTVYTCGPGSDTVCETGGIEHRFASAAATSRTWTGRSFVLSWLSFHVL